MVSTSRIVRITVTAVGLRSWVLGGRRRPAATVLIFLSILAPAGQDRIPGDSERVHALTVCQARLLVS